MNIEHELMAAERALRAIAEKTGADYVHFAFYREIRKIGVSIHNGNHVKSGMGKALNDAVDEAMAAKPFDATPKEDVA